jgi:subtilase family serine protease
MSTNNKCKNHIKTLDDDFGRPITVDFSNLKLAVGNTNAIAYTPAQIKTAYGLNNFTETGAGQTIAIIACYKSPAGKLLNDLNVFRAQYGITTTLNLTIYSYGTATNTNWYLEECLDTQWAHAIAPGANILVVEAADATVTNILKAINYANTRGATIVSMSFGIQEFASESSYNPYFSKNGIIYTASSGDNGSSVGVSWPAIVQTVLSVGGTTVQLNPDDTIASEVGWSNSGGGASIYLPIPTYQSSYGLTGNRQNPDISLNADPNYGYYIYNSVGYNGSTGWFIVGGTSASNIILAGIFAIINQKRVAIGKSRLTSINNGLQNVLYGTVANIVQNYGNDFNDITSGTNGNFNCVSGYDNVTGLGAPKNTSAVLGFINAFVNLVN